MRNKYGKKKSAKSVFGFFRKMAQYPFVAFLSLFLVAATVAGWIFLSYQNIYSSGSGTDAPAVAAADAFNHAKAEKYRQVFSIMEQREKEYRGQSEPSAAVR